MGGAALGVAGPVVAPNGEVAAGDAPNVKGAGEDEALLSLLPKLKGGAELELEPKLKPPGPGAGVDGLLAAAPKGFEGAAGVEEAAFGNPNMFVGLEALTSSLGTSFGADAPNAKGAGAAGVAALLVDLPKSKEVFAAGDELLNVNGAGAEFVLAGTGVVGLTPPNKGFDGVSVGFCDPKRPPAGVEAGAAGWLAPNVNGVGAAGLSTDLP